MLTLDKKQQDLLMTFKQSIKESEINIKSNIDEAEDKIVHSDFRSNLNAKEIIMNRDKTNYNRNIYTDLTWGDVLYVDLNLDNSGIGSEQRGIRYAVVIQNDIGNQFSPTVIVAFVTSKLTKAKMPLIHVEIPAGKFGLPKDSVVLLEQVRTLDKRRIIKRVGRLDEETSLKIEKALGASTSRKLKPKTPLERLPIKVQDIVNDKLDDIRSIEKTICNIVYNDEYLKRNLLEQRECQLLALERICKKYNIDYKDYYVMYKKEDERIVV